MRMYKIEKLHMLQSRSLSISIALDIKDVIKHKYFN